MTKSIMDISVLKFKHYKIPVFVEKQNKDWVYYGENNDYPQYLVSLFNKSPKHNSIVTSKCKYILGKGWEIDKLGIPVTQQAILQNYIEKPNPYESLNDLTRKVILDYILHGGFAMEIVWNRKGTKIAEFSHLNFADVRKLKEGDNYVYTRKWFEKRVDGTLKMTQNPQDNEDWREYAPYDPEKPKGKQILYYKSYNPDMDVYPIPDYKCIPAIECDFLMGEFHLNNIKSGFFPSHIINFYGAQNVSKEERAKTRKQIEDELCGTEAKKFILNFVANKDMGGDVVTLSASDIDKQFDLLEKWAEQDIFTGHKVSPMLYGIKTEGQLGGRTEIIEQNELHQNTYVTPTQKIFEDIFNELISHSGLEGRLKLSRLEPIGFQFSEQIISQFLPKEAIAQMIADKMGIDLKKYANKELAKPIIQKKEFKNENKEANLDTFKKYGQDASLFTEIKSRSVEFSDETSELKFTQEYFKELTIRSLDKAVLDLIKKDTMQRPEELAKVLNSDKGTIERAIARLKEGGYLESKKVQVVEKKEPEYSLTQKADELLNESPAKTEEIFVMYKYEERPDAPALKGESREFCKELLNLNKLYTLEEINQMSAEEDRDVWKLRGGWYTNPETGVARPSCRHEWAQKIVRKNGD